MERYIEITKNEFDDVLKQEKGWIRNISGYEYVYDYTLHNCNRVMIKVMSSVSVNNAVSRNKGSDSIRVFSVLLDNDGKVIRGLTKAIRVYRTKNWRDNVKKAFVVTKTKALRNMKWVKII
jgi:hypothetical protein